MLAVTLTIGTLVSIMMFFVGGVVWHAGYFELLQSAGSTIMPTAGTKNNTLVPPHAM